MASVSEILFISKKESPIFGKTKPDAQKKVSLKNFHSFRRFRKFSFEQYRRITAKIETKKLEKNLEKTTSPPKLDPENEPGPGPRPLPCVLATTQNHW